MLNVSNPDWLYEFFADALAPAVDLFIDTDYIQRGDLISACVAGDVRTVRVIYVNESEATATVQWRAGSITRQAKVVGNDVIGVFAREPLQRGDRVEVFRFGHLFDATVWAVHGGVVELTSGVCVDYCMVSQRISAAAETAETVSA